jgi:uncharacterized protein YkwD
MKNWLKITLLSLTAFLGSLGFVGLSLPTAPLPPETAVVKPVEVAQKPLLELVNALRAEKGVPLLTASPELDKSAQDKANDMVTRHYFDHKSPDGINGWTLISNYLPNTTRRSENLTVCVPQDNNQGAFNAWLNSPAHYQGMIDPRVTLYGTATAWDDVKHCTVYVNHFAAL